MAESMRFDITGRDVGGGATLRGLARDSDLAATQTRRLAESMDAQRRAAATSAAATLAAAKADKILKDASDDAIAATVKQRIETDKLKTSAKETAGKNGLAALAGGGGIAGGGMGALIAAGAALAPVLVTVGAGLGGLSLAALAAGKNSKQLKAELDPLKDQFAAFGKSVQPVLLSDFAAAARVAGHVLTDIRPVTIATGKALAGFLGQFGQTLQSGEFRQFWQFMGNTASADVRLLGQNVIDLTKALPPLLQDLQPLATGLLQVSDDAIKAAGGVARFYDSFQKNVPVSNQHTINFLRDLDRWTVDLTNHIPGGKAINDWLTGVQHNTEGVAGAEKLLSNAVVPVNVGLANQAKRLNVLAGAQEHELGALENYINLTLAQKGDLVALNQALKASGDRIGYKTAKERASFAAAQTYIDNTVKQGNAALSAHKGIDAQISSIEHALPKLEQVKGKTAEYKQELDLLKGILDKLRREKLIQEQLTVFGSGNWHVAGAPHGVPGIGGKLPFAAGGVVRGGVPGTDSVPIMAMPGEVVVPAKMVAAGLVDHLRGVLPGFAAGGIVPSYKGGVAGLPPWTSHNQLATVTTLTTAIARALVSSLGSMGGFGGGPVGGDAAANLAIGRRMFPWPAYMWPAQVALWNRESGWSRFAYNASSGATGIPQALPYTKMPRAAWLPFQGGSANAAAQIGWGYGYERGRYGTPLAAWAHEVSAGWYGSGLRGGIFTRPTPIVVGDKQPERVDVTPLGSPGGGAGTTVNNYVTVQLGHGTHPVAAAQEIAKLLNAGAKAGVRVRKSILGPG